jgi:hypothetical protein
MNKIYYRITKTARSTFKWNKVDKIFKILSRILWSPACMNIVAYISPRKIIPVGGNIKSKSKYPILRKCEETASASTAVRAHPRRSAARFGSNIFAEAKK